jgi:hypothetical protein
MTYINKSWPWVKLVGRQRGRLSIFVPCRSLVPVLVSKYRPFGSIEMLFATVNLGDETSAYEYETSRDRAIFFRIPLSDIERDALRKMVLLNGAALARLAWEAYRAARPAACASAYCAWARGELSKSEKRRQGQDSRSRGKGRWDWWEAGWAY